MLTVNDIREKEFDHSKRGYNEDQVDDFLDEIADQMQKLVKENNDLLKKIEETESRLTEAVAQKAGQETAVAADDAKPFGDDNGYFRNLETTLRETLISAQRIADETFAEANRKAKETLDDAEIKAAGMTSQAKAEVEASKLELEGVKQLAKGYREKFTKMMKEQLAALGINEEDVVGESKE